MNAKWFDTSGKPGETDCILTIDKTIGLFEAKSGRITPPARRGAEERLARQINELMVKPSRQSARFETLLKSDPTPIQVNSPEGPKGIGGSDTREVVRINILFDTLGPLSACSGLLKRAGFIAPDEAMAPTMSIFELESVLTLLSDQVSRLHYLRRRNELERTFIFDADELDLIAFYLSNCFCIGGLPPGAEGFGIYGWSEALAGTYDLEGSRSKQLPKVRRTPLWETIIQEVEKQGTPGWTRFGYFLSNIPYRDQWTLQRLQEKLSKKASKLRPGKSIFSAAHGPGEAPAPTIVLGVGNDVSEDGVYSSTNKAAHIAMQSAGSKEALVLFWDVAAPKLPYRFIATMKWVRLPSS